MLMAEGSFHVYRSSGRLVIFAMLRDNILAAVFVFQQMILMAIGHSNTILYSSMCFKSQGIQIDSIYCLGSGALDLRQQ